MKAHVVLEVDGRHIDQTFVGADSDEIVSKAKEKVAAELGWKGLILRGMSTLTFAQKAVELYNQKHKTNYAPPETTLDFLRLGQDLGYVTELE